MPQVFTTTFEIESAIRWELYKANLADKLIDLAADDPFCPTQIKESAYTGEGRQFFGLQQFNQQEARKFP